LVARLTHPHILPLFDSGEADGFLYFVTPSMEGASLRDAVRVGWTVWLGPAPRQPPGQRGVSEMGDGPPLRYVAHGRPPRGPSPPN
jgi:hypothetical protein